MSSAAFLDWAWVYPARIQLLWVALVVLGGLLALELRSRSKLGGLLSPLMQDRLSLRHSHARVWTRFALIGVAAAACILALRRPQAAGVTMTVDGPQARGDVQFVLDVSRSMLAEDASPNRLARAKAEISQIAGDLDRSRVGLVVFAGRAVAVCPLTPDHAYFDLALADVDTHSAGRGGTRIGDAIRAAVHGFEAGAGAKMIVLITDGEDQTSFPLDAAKEARDAGVKIVAVGLGSEAGSPIEITNPATGAKEPLLYDGQPVISKLDAATLRQMALTTEGAYVPAGTASLDLESVIDAHVAPVLEAGGTSTERKIPAERYPGLVLLALVALLAALWVGSQTSAAPLEARTEEPKR